MFLSFVVVALLRIAFYTALVVLGLYIYRHIRIYRELHQKKHIIKIIVCVCVFVCLCFLGFTEPNVKPRIEMSTVENMYNFLEETGSSEEYYDFDVGYASGYTGFVNVNTFEYEKKELFEYGEIGGLEIYYKPYKCYRWDATTHLPVDFLGIPDVASAAEVYLVSSDKVGYIYLDYNYYSVGLIFSGIVHPSFVYRPKIDFDDIVSFLINTGDGSRDQSGDGSMSYYPPVTGN